MKKRILLTIFTFIGIYSFAQTPNMPIGSWKSHTPGRICKSIAATENYIYAASENNIIRYSKSDNTAESVSKIDGFYNINVSCLRYNETYKTLIIGYVDGAIDLVTNAGISPVNDILRANVIGSKRINHIMMYKNLAYISCGFGVVVFDLQKKEVKETYNSFGPNGLQLTVNWAGINNDSLFLSTNNGVMVSDLKANLNLMDANSWYTYPSAGSFISTKINFLAGNKSGMYAASSDGKVFKLTGNSWQSFTLSPSLAKIYSLQSTQNKIHISGGSSVIEIDETGTQKQYAGFSNVQEAILDANNKFWGADLVNGIVEENNTKHYVNGPYSASVFKMGFYLDNLGVQNLCVTTSGFNASGIISYNPNGFYIYREGIWENYNSTIGNAPVQAYTGSAYNLTTNSLFISSFNGLNNFYRKGVEKDSFYTYTSKNTQPEPIVDLWDGGNGYFMYDTKFDKGLQWVSMYRINTGQYNLFSINAKNETKGYNFPDIGEVSNYPVEILIDNNSNKWLRYANNRGGGILVFNENATGKKYKYLTDQASEGKLSSKLTYCMAKSIKGDIWVGTDKGVCVFYSPNKVLTSTSFDATLPIIGNRPLLRDQVVKTIAVDGANRKWLGTTNGVYLVNEDGSEELAHYTSANSPLPSDNIYDIKVNYVSGEVFIGTAAGIVSYKTDATLGAKADLEGNFNAKVFPNPVTPEFDGLITVNNLPNNTNVKFTDVNGVLVYETTANGGTATWNGITVSGNKANTGIYLVFCSNIDGSEVLATKFSIIK